MFRKTKKNILVISVLLLLSVNSFSQNTPKREFRGVWMHVVGPYSYKNQHPEDIKQFLRNALNNFQELGMNAVIFQVRPTADALYSSEIEPWSKYLTGQQGKAPIGNFDLMEFMIRECHKRNIEFHAWINPYRVTLGEMTPLDKKHIYFRHPEWFVQYNSQIYFDPGVPNCRKHICSVVQDIVKRYDVDAIHMDDYFYPYPIAGEVFPDDISFSFFNKKFTDKGEWRRNNVNLLIQEIKQSIVKTKPWVRFGISPFGIYRNRKSTPDGSGSNTNGLQAYDDLYADVKLWVQKGWIDYNIPQLYWEIGHKDADYETLIHWWNKNNYGAHLYIGQDVPRTMNATDPIIMSKNQLPRKLKLEQSLPAVYGRCFWSGYDVLNNTGEIADSLYRNYQRYPALIPAYLHMHNKSPNEVRALKAGSQNSSYKLYWKRNGDPKNPKNAQYYVVYRSLGTRPPNLNDPSAIVAITRETEIRLPYQTGNDTYTYIVTSVDRYHNESQKGKSITVRL